MEKIWKERDREGAAMNIDEMKRIKREHGMTYEMISKESGVPLATVQKIFAGISKSPRYSTMDKLEAFFMWMDTRTIEERYHEYLKDHYIPDYGKTFSDEEVSEHVREYASVRDEHTRRRWGIPYKEQGEYTKEDYYMIPGEYRVELIEGKIHKLNSPKTRHQAIVGELFRLLANYIHNGKGGCVPLLSPYSVELETKKDTVVQPDLLVICKERRKNIKIGHMYGAPDLIVEVLSPSTKKYDMLDKLHVYQISGVREYWIVDLYEKHVIVYDFSSEVTPSIYGFSDKVPVGIYDGDLVIDFAEIDEYMEEVYGDLPEDDEDEED